MTTQKSCSEKSNIVRNYGFSGKYFLSELRRSWPFAVLIFAAFLFLMPVVMMMSLGGMPVNIPGVREVTKAEQLEYVLRRINAEDFQIIWSLVVTGFAMLSGWKMCAYLSNKVHSDFVHCLPIRREAVFATKFLTTFIDFLIGILPNIFLTVFACLAASELGTYGFGDILSSLLRFFLKALLLYITVFVITNLAGMLSGTVVMHIFMTFFLNFALVVYYTMIYVLAYFYTHNLNAEHYMTLEIVRNLCPVIKVFTSFFIPISALDVFGVILLDVILIFVSILLYKVRKVERAGTPIVFKPVERVLKYLCVIPCTVFFGALLEGINGGDGWLIIGYIFGAVFSFMFMNFILTKNARKIFAGIKGFAVYAVLFVLVIVGCNLNFFGIDDHVPNVAKVDSIEVSIDGVASNLEIREYKLKTDIVNFYKNYIERYQSPSGNKQNPLATYGMEEIAYEKYDYDERYIYHLEYEFDGVTEYRDLSFYPVEYKFGSYMELVFKREGSLDFAVKVRAYNSEEYSALAEKIVRSREFSKNIVEMLDMDNIQFARYGQYAQGKEDIYYYADSTDPLSGQYKTVEAMMKTLRAEYSKKNVFEENSVVVGVFRVQTKDNVRMNIPVYSSFDSQKLFTGYDSEEELTERRTELTEFAVICDVSRISDKKNAEDCSVLITDKSQLKEILSSLNSINDYKDISSIEREPRYAIAYAIVEVSTDYYDGGEYAKYPEIYKTYFKQGNVPEFVAGLFN